MTTEQQRMLRALMGGMSGTGQESIPALPFDALPGPNSAASELPIPDMLASFMNAIPPSQQQQRQAKPRTLFHRLLPIIHLLSVWALVAYYVLIAEPTTSPAPVSTSALVRRWASLASSRPHVEAFWGMGPVVRSVMLSIRHFDVGHL
jgi:hypothetical protein